MVAVVGGDTGSRFIGAFEAMFKCLQIILWYLARGNHKVNIIEKYHKFPKKIQAVAGKYCGSHDVFIQNAKTSQYAWKSVSIYVTNVMRSIASVGR